MIFSTNSLLSKWGHSDGDMLEDLLDWAGFDDCDQPAWVTLPVQHGFEHTVLALVVVTHVVPAIDQRVDVEVISTIHNPIRARRVDGREVQYPDDDTITLTPATVEVPDEVILSIARSISLPAVKETR